VSFHLPRRLAVVLGLVLAGVLGIAACSSGGSGGASAAPGSAASPAGARSGAAITIATRHGTDGTYLTNRSGRAVYLWVADTSDSSTCSGACAAAWPPVTTKGAPQASGSAHAGDLGTTRRSGGTLQVTYDGHPLYYYAGDTGAGQTNGQGSNGFGAKWWLVAPSGSAITGAGTTSAPTGHYNY
jgi:predicted lipoprotein with Yx(FWY)xxD motif